MLLSNIDSFIVLLYLCGLVVMGIYFRKFVNTSQDYFLAGRMLPFWAIGMSIVVSDIGALDFVGLSGQAYRYGIVAANFDWIGSIPALVLAAFVFMPYFWRSGIYTIPEYLGRRYNTYVRSIHALVLILFMAFNLGIILWATGVFISELSGLPVVAVICITAAIAGFYTILGGLSAVVMMDVVQMIIMFIGGMAVLVLGIWEIGGWNAMVTKILSMGPEYADHFNLIISPKANTPYPWTGILFGLALVIAPAYFIGNQAIVQRTLGARDEWNAKAGMLFGAFLKMFIPVLFVIPGLIALALYPNITDGDKSFPVMVKNLLPPGMTGLVFAAFFAGLMSSVDSYINSAATIWTKDIYEKFIKKNATDRHYLVMGRVFTGIILLIAIMTAPISSLFPGLYVYTQTLHSLFLGPTLAMLLLGIFWMKTTQWGGLAALVGGMFLAALMHIFKRFLFTIEDPFLYVAWWSFFGSIILGITVSLFTRPKPIGQLHGLVYGLVGKDEEIQMALKKNINE